MIKSIDCKLKLKTLIKRDYKDFCKKSTFRELKQGLNNNVTFSNFNHRFKETLDRHVPIKVTELWGNLKSHFQKTPQKDIMKGSRLKNKADETG